MLFRSRGLVKNLRNTATVKTRSTFRVSRGAGGCNKGDFKTEEEIFRDSYDIMAR